MASGEANPGSELERFFVLAKRLTIDGYVLSDDGQRHHWLKRIGVSGSALDYEADVDATLDRLADHIEKYLDCDRLLALAREPRLKTSSSATR